MSSLDAYKGGDGFVASYKLFNQMILENQDIVLVHALVIGQGPLKGIKYCHAWVEDTRLNLVYDYSNNRELVIPKEIYYRAGKVSEVHKYDSDAVWNQAVMHKTYGPWDENLLNNPY